MNPMSRHTRFGHLVRRMQTLLVGSTGAEAVTGATLASWCALDYPGLPASKLKHAAVLRRDPLVASLVAFIREEGDFLQGAYWLSSTYAVLAGDEHRQSHSLYFTPPAVTGYLLDSLTNAGVDFGTRHFCDPACGGGAFLAPIALRIRSALKKKSIGAAKVLTHIETHLSGADRDPVLCKLSCHFLAMALRDEVLAVGRPLKIRIETGDSLKKFSRRQGEYDVVVCNPPFRKLTAIEAEPYRASLGEVILGHPNLYALFMALCVTILKPGGACALVTPTSFLSGRYFSKLRTFLRAKTRIQSIGVLSDKAGVFLGVQQEAAITVVLRPRKGEHLRAKPEILVVSMAGQPVILGKTQLPNSGLAWPIPRAEEDAALLRSMVKLKFRFTDYGYTPQIGGFVWNRDVHDTYATKSRVPRSRRARAVPLLWSSDVQAETGKLRFGCADKKKAEDAWVDMGSTTHSFLVRAPSLILQRVTSNEQPKRLVSAAIDEEFIAVHGGFVGENHTVVLERTDPNASFSPGELAALISCDSIERYFRCISGSTNVSVFELNQLPLPDPRRLRHAIGQGEELTAAAERLMR